MSKSRVLIVDDNPKNIQVLGNILSENNYEIEYAENGEEAVEIVADDDFDVILMDVMMPIMNGFEACTSIKANKEKSEIPIIFLTAKTDSESISKGFECGGIDYVTKPFNQNELLARVETHVSLKASKDQLKNMNRILEEKVEERTEELRIANEELSELDTAKNEFLKIISHEIRTPLNGIFGFMDILKDKLDDKQKQLYIQSIDTSCKNLENFTLRALKISELRTSGEQTLRRDTHSSEQIITEVISCVQDQLQNKQIELNTKLKKVDLFVDAELLFKCIEILLLNAIKHSATNSTIELSGVQENTLYKIEIRDNGEGFSQSILSSGLKPFISPNHVNANPGLDLYLCKLIMEAHGGNISIKNNNGAIITLKLPI